MSNTPMKSGSSSNGEESGGGGNGSGLSGSGAAPPIAGLNKVSEFATSYASANGIQVERRQDGGNNKESSSSSYFVCAPMSLLPNAYPRTAFVKAKQLAPSFNLLVDRVSRDHDFLQSTLGGGVSDSDPYTAKLLELYNDIYVTNKDASGNFAPIADRLGIHRSDYMLNSDTTTTTDSATEEEKTEQQLKQVELNTIASSFAGLAVNIAALHRNLVTRFQDDVVDFLQTNKYAIGQTSSSSSSGDKNSAVVDAAANDDDDDIPTEGVPVNPALDKIPYAMKVTHEQYLNRFCTGLDSKNCVILFVVQDGESNTVDQRLLEFRLWEDHHVPVVRMSLTRANTDIILNDQTGALTISSTGQEISLVYYRAGYAPTDYPDGYNGVEWAARAKLEKSRATKAPCLGYHLSGTKKVQQELARPGVLEKFFSSNTDTDTTTTSLMRSAFAGLYSLGEDATNDDKQIVQKIVQNPNEESAYYVLKPQREGGGYNYYNDRLAQKLIQNVTIHESSDNEEEVELDKSLGEFILMQRLFPPKQDAILLRNGNVEGMGLTISELGCFGTVLASNDGQQILHNEYAGFLLRTKFSDVDEGGVAAGFATLSSPYLC